MSSTWPTSAFWAEVTPKLGVGSPSGRCRRAGAYQAWTPYLRRSLLASKPDLGAPPYLYRLAVSHITKEWLRVAHFAGRVAYIATFGRSVVNKLRA